MKSARDVFCCGSTNHRRNVLRRILSCSALTAGILLSGGTAQWIVPSAQAASAAPPQRADIEEVIVTGSRIVRDGYDSPTPLTVISAESLQNTASNNIADVMRTFPAFAGSTTPQSNFTSVSAQGAGLNLLNLRSLGANRTLILIDGQRSVAARVDGVVDINNVPQELVS